MQLLQSKTAHLIVNQYIKTKKAHKICFFMLAICLTTSRSLWAFNPSDSIKTRYSIGTVSLPNESEIQLTLQYRFQHYNERTIHENDKFDPSIHSPKSVTFSADGRKFYVQSLEGHVTSVYDATTMTRIKEIHHQFLHRKSYLFHKGESTVFDYKYREERQNPNIFKGKPVESCLSHKGKYLWVTYYRRDYDLNAESPSALAIIDTDADTIVRVMPTGPLPKMIACSPDNRFVAVTHWGDNTVGLIDITAANVMDFKYVAHLIVDAKAKLEFGDELVNRDQNCGHCLRGTVFTPDSKYLMVGKMGGSGGIALFDMQTFAYLGTVIGQKSNMRHMVLYQDTLYISTNTSGFVQKTSYKALIHAKLNAKGKTTVYTDWETCFVGPGARTIDISPDGKYVFACVNNQCNIAVVRTQDMQVVCTVGADAYPVGMAISPDGSKLIITSQGKADKGGNSVMVYEVSYKQPKE
jgi:DNA-binding beta-propeller fold protein YncE